MTEKAADVLSGSLKDFRSLPGSDLIGRTGSFFAWQDRRRMADVWPYARATTKAPQPRCEALTDDGRVIGGVNFASQDYLGLSSHPAVRDAAIEAIHRYGVHSAGSAALLGNTANSLRLQEELGAFIDDREIVLYPTGWGAGYGSIQGFVRPDDHIVMDILSHSCLQEGARVSTKNVHLHRHLDLEGVQKHLQRIRRADSQNGIMVVTESLFSMHSDTPDLLALRDLCTIYGATLLVDCAHDMGSMGPDGLGFLGWQNALTAADVIIGSFSKTFASNGGFIAVKDKATAEYLRYYSATHTFSNALSAVQCATILKALEIVRSQEGAVLRGRLMDNILRLRSGMEEQGVQVLGTPSPIVPVYVGAEAVGRVLSKHLSAGGCIANLVEYPAVARSESRFRFQVMATHTSDEIDDAVRVFADAAQAARTEIGAIAVAAE